VAGGAPLAHRRRLLAIAVVLIFGR
jgi:hypothetical protein